MSGKLEPGAKLPNENEIAERFGVSRATVREAVLGLMEAGYLARRHGSGTYVTKAPRSRHALDTTVSYTEMIREAGHEPERDRDHQGRARARPTHERELLELADGEQVLELERVRLADRRPVIYSRDRIAAALLRDVPDEALRRLAVRRAALDAGHEVVPRHRRTAARRSPTRSSPSCSRSSAARRCCTSTRPTTTRAATP